MARSNSTLLGLNQCVRFFFPKSICALFLLIVAFGIYNNEQSALVECRSTSRMQVHDEDYQNEDEFENQGENKPEENDENQVQGMEGMLLNAMDSEPVEPVEEAIESEPVVEVLEHLGMNNGSGIDIGEMQEQMQQVVEEMLQGQENVTNTLEEAKAEAETIAHELLQEESERFVQDFQESVKEFAAKGPEQLNEAIMDGFNAAVEDINLVAQQMPITDASAPIFGAPASADTDNNGGGINVEVKSDAKVISAAEEVPAHLTTRPRLRGVATFLASFVAFMLFAIHSDYDDKGSVLEGLQELMAQSTPKKVIFAIEFAVALGLFSVSAKQFLWTFFPYLKALFKDKEVQFFLLVVAISVAGMILDHFRLIPILNAKDLHKSMGTMY